MSLRLQNYLPWAKQVGFDVIVTDGVPTESGPPKGALAVDKTNGTMYQNQGTAAVANWIQFEAGAGSIVVSDIEGLADGEFIIGTNGTPAGNAKVTMGGEGSLANDGTFTVGVMADVKTIRRTDDGAVGAGLILDHVSATPAANDVVGGVSFSGKDDAAGDQTYVEVYGVIQDPSAGADYGRFEVKVLDAGAFPGASQFSLNATELRLRREDDGTAGYQLVFDQDSASPAIGDVLGALLFFGDDDAANETQYCSLGAIITDPTDGSEEGAFGVTVVLGGATPSVPQLTVDGEGITLTREDDGDTGPGMTMMHSSASPAASDNIGGFSFKGKDDAANNVEYAAFGVQILDPTAGAMAAGYGILLQNGTGALPTDPQFSVNGASGSIGVTREDDGTEGAALVLTQISASAAAEDIVGFIKFNGMDDAPAASEYAQIRGVIVDPTAGAEFGRLDFLVMNGTGTMTKALDITHNGSYGHIAFATSHGYISAAGNVVLDGAALKYGVREVAAGTLVDSPDETDGLISISTNGVANCVPTLPEAADNLGLVLTFTFDADAGTDVVITRAGADTIDENGDTGNTTCTLANAGETIQLMAVQDNIWLVVSRVGGVLA